MDISELKKSDSRSFHRHPWEKARVKIVMDLLRKTGPLPINHLVDIGCGDAYVASRLMSEKMVRKYSAIDNALDEKIMASLTQAHPAIHFYKDLDQAAGQMPPADVVLILDVMEHVPDEKAFLDAIKKGVSPGENTQWIITVPAFLSIFSRHDVLLGHYRRYVLATLTEVCRKNGLVIKKKGYFFLSLLLARIAARIMGINRVDKKTGKQEDTIQNWQGNTFLTYLYTGLLRIDYTIGVIISKLGVNMPGLSCYCICHTVSSPIKH